MKRRNSTKKRRKSSSFSKILVTLLLLCGLAVVIYYFYQSDEKKIQKHELIASIPKGFNSFGIDVSHHQGTIDWENLLIENELDSVITFIYCKATEGVDHVDSEWSKNRASLLELGKSHGAYHFFSVKSDPELQAQHFLTHWKRETYDLPPVLDVETEAINDKALISSMNIWLQRIEKESGMRPIIYTSLHFYETKFKEEFKDHLFWIAAYSRKPECLIDKRVLHWQYTDGGNLPGIKEKVDFNVSKTDYAH
jgi:lysozyme